MTDKTAQLNAELEELRQDRDFMYKTLRRPSISRFLDLGRFHDGVWKTYSATVGTSSAKRHCESKTPEETYQAVDMRCLLYSLFWTLQGRAPQKKDPMEQIGNDAFWLEYLHLAKAGNWQSKQVQQAILDSNSPDIISQKFRVAAWLYLFAKCPKHCQSATLPPAAFERLESVDFSPEQKVRWGLLVGFGQESLFKKQLFRTNMAMDMSSASLSDWFSFALSKRRSDIVCHWLEKYPEEALGLSYRDILLYVVSNFHGDYGIKPIQCLEQLSPGLCANFRDRHHNNLLWYSTGCWQLRSKYAKPNGNDIQPHKRPKPDAAEKAWGQLVKKHGDANGSNSGNRKLLALLFGLGISPYLPNDYGFSFQELDNYGLLVRQRWQVTRLQQQTPDFDNDQYWHLEPESAEHYA